MTSALLERVQTLHPDSPVWTAQPKQATFLTADEFEVLYGGAAGGGKTDALLVFAKMFDEEFPGAQGMFMRRTFPDLSMQGGAIPRSHDLFRGHGVWNGQEHRWTFRGGGSLQFGHLEHAYAHFNYRGAQLDYLLWDELTQALLEQYLFLRSRVRPTRAGIKPKIRAATNPGDVGHAWVKDRWVDAAPWGEPFLIATEGAEPSTARFIPAKLEDNPVQLERDPSYRDRLAGLPENLRRAYLDGDWDIFEGQYFAEWRREVHVCASFDVPETWTKWVAIDYGFADPFCALWFARDPETRRVYVYRELYLVGLRDEQQARLIAERSRGERIAVFAADPSMFNKRGEQNRPSIAAVYHKAGVPVKPATNSRVAGWQAVRRLLASGEDRPPRLQVMEDRCPNLIRTLPEMVHDPLDPEDLADEIRGKKTEDHAVDCARYGAMVEAAPARKSGRAATKFGA